MEAKRFEIVFESANGVSLPAIEIAAEDFSAACDIADAMIRVKHRPFGLNIAKVRRRKVIASLSPRALDPAGLPDEELWILIVGLMDFAAEEVDWVKDDETVIGFVPKCRH